MRRVCAHRIEHYYRAYPSFVNGCRMIAFMFTINWHLALVYSLIVIPVGIAAMRRLGVSPARLHNKAAGNWRFST